MDLGSEAIDTFERFPERVVQAIRLRQRLGPQTSEIDGLGDKTGRVTFIAPGLNGFAVSLIIGAT